MSLLKGTYLFVGSPKVGKSFMMAHLAYHISTGTPLWEYKVRKATVLYFALEDDYPRLQKRLFQMFGAKRQAICISQRNVKRSMADWKNR